MSWRVVSIRRANPRLTLGGELVLRCQRCLGAVRFQLEAVRNFVLVPAGRALSDPADEAEDTEQLYADPKLDVIALVEDEVILGLPMVAGHEEGACAAPLPKAEAGRPESPFNALVDLERQ
jgi:uncharacterized protein